MRKALLLVDLQNDFCAGGRLAVPEGEKVMAIANQIQKDFDLIIITKDWHPQNHKSFAINHPHKNMGDRIMLHGIEQILWPVHCIQGTKGAELHPDLRLERVDHIVFKGIDAEIDSYSAFFDNQHARSTGLVDYLKEQDVREITVMGLATDYCVKYTCLDAIALGFRVNLVLAGCRGVELQKGDVQDSLDEMKKMGVHFK